MKKPIGIFWRRILPWLGVAHVALFYVFWLTNRLFYDSVNTFIMDKVGIKLDYISICLVFALLVGIGGLLVIGFVKSKSKRWGTVLFAIFGFLFIVFFYGSFFVLFKQDAAQPVRLLRMLRYNGLYFYIALLAIVVVLLVRVVQPFMKKIKGAGKPGKVHVLVDSILLFGLVWGAGLGWLPTSVVRGELPAKPLVIGHRGAAMLAPENTIASAELAAELGADGVETDIRISADGVPFLMHDRTLLRTTDASEIFPGREKEDASLFTMAELQQLDAGEWFNKADPFGTIEDGKVSADQLAVYAQQMIPDLHIELEVVAFNKLIFIFDLLAPLEGHPYHDTFFDICFEQIRQSGVTGNKVWFLLDEEEIPNVRELAPDMIATYGADFKNPPSTEHLKEYGYGIVNVGYGLPNKWIRAYREAGLGVNLYTVDEPWLFSDLWLTGATSMTTNNVQDMTALEKPVGSMSFGLYLIIWIVIGLVGAGVLVKFALKKD